MPACRTGPGETPQCPGRHLTRAGKRTRMMSAANFFKDVSDTYSRRARLFPGITITLPVSVLTVVLITTKPAWWSAVVLVLGASGVSFLGAQLVRMAGKGKEQALWARWGGAPTTQ